MTEPSKTAELEAKLNKATAMPGFTHAMPSSSFAAAEPLKEWPGTGYARAGGDSIAFPEPAASWGTLTHCFMANPKWRWWAFWRPRVLSFTMTPDMILGEPGGAPREIEISEH